MKKATAECPECAHKISVGFQPKLGQFITCPSCKTRLEVVWLDPLELDYPEDLDEDFEEDEFEEEDFEDDLEAYDELFEDFEDEDLDLEYEDED